MAWQLSHLCRNDVEAGAFSNPVCSNDEKLYNQTRNDVERMSNKTDLYCTCMIPGEGKVSLRSNGELSSASGHSRGSRSSRSIACSGSANPRSKREGASRRKTERRQDPILCAHARRSRICIRAGTSVAEEGKARSTKSSTIRRTPCDPHRHDQMNSRMRRGKMRRRDALFGRAGEHAARVERKTMQRKVIRRACSSSSATLCPQQFYG